MIADFLCTIADDSHRPQSQLNTTRAALSHLYDCYDIPCPADGKDITLFTSALIKSQTQHTMKKSTVMPIHKLTSMFLKWPEDSELSIKDLRLKCIVLLSLIFMCRPSDLAPKAQLFNPADSSTSNMDLSVDQVFLPDSNDSIIIKFLGIKNDRDRLGFEVSVDLDDAFKKHRKLNPVLALRSYITRTEMFRNPQKRSLFISLYPPYRALSARSIALILEDAISRAGLGGQGFSAKSFRPTGATYAVKNCDPDTVMKVGRWKTKSVFFNNYVHNKPPCDYAGNMLISGNV